MGTLAAHEVPLQHYLQQASQWQFNTLTKLVFADAKTM
jgi:hypothetical protein